MDKILGHISPVLPDGRYLHWNDLRRRKPPGGMSDEEWWLAHKLGRLGSRVMVPTMTQVSGQRFWFCPVDALARATHELDRRDATREMIAALGDEGARQAYRIDQLIEEAINSSVLEGAKLTTRAEAKAIIRDGRPPRDRGERMVMNNYEAMRHLLEMQDEPLTVEKVLEIHALLGDDALDGPVDAAGRFRTHSENVRIVDAQSGEDWFVPPPAGEIAHRMQALVDFANGSDDSRSFLHPLIRAIILHFWLAHIHPFVDGNGRMARALFYWQMLRSGYDFAQYLSISGPIDRSRRAYYLAFAHTETDDGDLTYFLLHQLAVLRKATEELLSHLRERSERLRELTSLVTATEALNRRQQDALLYAIRNPHQGLTVTGHAASHGVIALTARRDLHGLEALGYLRRVRVGHADRYYPTANFPPKVSS